MLWRVVVVLGAWIACAVAQQCVQSTQINKAPGTIRDRAPQVGNYNGGIDCHWRIATTKANTIISITFTMLNLNQYEGDSNDVLLINIGSGTLPPTGWSSYTRNSNLMGYDNVGQFDYISNPPSKDTCVANQGGNFNPYSCDLTYGSLLSDDSRNTSWFYFTGADEENYGYTMTMQSTAQDIYIIYRSFPKHDGIVLDQSTVYGFTMTYNFASAFCDGLLIVNPTLSVAEDANATAIQEFKDNMMGQNQLNMSCSWLLQPRRIDSAGKQQSFDSIWLSFSSFQLLGASVVSIYDGSSTSAKRIAQFTGQNPPPPEFFLANDQGTMLITYQSLKGPVAPGFTIHWQAAYCPSGCSGKNGDCMNGQCVCAHGWSGAACDIPQGWLCLGTHYNASDGCDCGCGLFDPDCGTLDSAVLGCSSVPSFDNTAYDASKGRMFNGDCIYCPLPNAIPKQTTQPDLDWNTTDGSIIESCPLVHQCTLGSQCDNYGTCVRVKNISTSNIVKQCSTSADCPAYTTCGANSVCQVGDDYALRFKSTSLNATCAEMYGFNVTHGFTIELSIQILSRSVLDTILNYPGIGIERSSSLTFTVATETWNSGIAIDDGFWYHFAWTWISATGDTALYLYNTTTNSSTMVASFTYSTTGVSLVPALPLKLGGFNGSVSYLRISTYVKDSTALFQPANMSNTVAEYRFLDGSQRDLSLNQNHLNISQVGYDPMYPTTNVTFAFGSSPGALNPCTALPLDVTNLFQVSAMIYTQAVMTGTSWSIGFYDSNSNAVVEALSTGPGTVQLSVAGSVVSTLALSGMQSLNKPIRISFRHSTDFTVVVCINDMTCSTISWPTVSGHLYFRTGAVSGLKSICASYTNDSDTIASLVVPTPITTFNGSTCTFPMTFSIRDCTKYQAYLTSNNYMNTMAAVQLQSYTYQQLDQQLQPCQCDVMPTWAVQQTLIAVDSDSSILTFQVTYNYIKTKLNPDSSSAPCSANCYIFEPAGSSFRRRLSTSSSTSTSLSSSSSGLGSGSTGGSTSGSTSGSGSNTQAPMPTTPPPILAGTQAKLHQVTRDFRVQITQQGPQVMSASAPGEVSTERCLITGHDASSILTNLTAYSCQNFGASTQGPTVLRPWCLVNGAKQSCMGETNPCGVPSGQATLHNNSGYISDGYGTTSSTTTTHLCSYTIAPKVPSALEPYTTLQLTMQQIQLSSNDMLVITSGNQTTAQFSGNVAQSDLSTVVVNTTSVQVSYDGAGDKSGLAFDGFAMEYDTIYSFSQNSSTHFCHQPFQSLSLNNQQQLVFPTYNLTSNLAHPNQHRCNYTFATNNSLVSSLWLSFLEINLTDANGGSGDRIEIYDVQNSSNFTLLANLTNSSFTQVNYPLSFNGISDYIISLDKLSFTPKTIVFWLYMSSTTKADCTITSNCISGKPKPMLIAGSDRTTALASYFAVVVAPDTGYISYYINGMRYTAEMTVLQDTWYHIALVHHAAKNDVFFYADGLRQTVSRSGSLNTSLIAVDTVLYVGAQASDLSTINFVGQLQQLRFYDERKTMHQIQRMRTRACDASDRSLRLCYELETYNASFISDSSAYNVHGVLHGCSYGVVPTTSSSIFPKIFTSVSSQLMLSYIPSSTNSSSYFRVLVQGKSCPSSCNNGTCVNGACHCQPGYAGEDCLEQIGSCVSHLLLPSSSGSLIFPPPSNREFTHFVPERLSTGYAPLNCSWHFQKSNSLIVFQLSQINLDSSDTLAMYEGEHIENVYYDGTQHNLPADLAISRALFYQRTNAIGYTVAFFKNTTDSYAQVVLAQASNSLHRKYDHVTYQRGLACKDAADVDLTYEVAREAIESFWWTTPPAAYTTQIRVVQLYFNVYDNTSANVTAEFVEIDVDGVSIIDNPYPAVFVFKRQNQAYTVCQNGSEVGLDQLDKIVKKSWPTRFSRKHLLSSFDYTEMVPPTLEYVGAWRAQPNGLYSGLLRKDMYDFISTIQSSNRFTIIVNTSVVLSNSAQFLFAQEESNYGSMGLKITAANKGQGLWVFGAYQSNEPVAMSPTSYSGDSVVIAITFNSGVIGYYMNGVLYSTYDTNAASESCWNQQWDQYMYTGIWVNCPEPILGFSDQSRLIIGGRFVKGQPLDTWRGTIYSVQMYTQVLPDSVIAAAFTGMNVVQAFVPEAVYINSLDSPTQAAVSAIDVLVTKVDTMLVSSAVIRQWTLRRLGCSIPSIDLNLTAQNLTTILNMTINQARLIYNGFDDTSALISYNTTNGTLLQYSLSRTKKYAFGLTDTIAKNLLLNYGIMAENLAYPITQLWVNTISSANATITFEFWNEARASVAATAQLLRVKNTWQMPTSVQRLVPPSFGVVPVGRCGPNNQTLTAFSGFITDGQPSEWLPVPVSGQCQWTVQAPSGVKINLYFPVLSIKCTEGSLLLQEPGRPAVSLCNKNSGFSFTTHGNSFTLAYHITVSGNTMQSAGFYAIYVFDGWSTEPNTTDAPFTYSPWVVQSQSRNGSLVCQLNTSDEAEAHPWQVVNSVVISNLNTSCYNSTMMPPNDAWYVSSCDESTGVTTCSSWVNDPNVPWTVTSIKSLNSTALYTSPRQKVKTPSLVINSTTSTINSSIYESVAGRVEVALSSKLGGRGHFRIDYYMPREYYVAPGSYQSSDSDYGDGSRETPYTHTFEYLINNILQDGDMLILYPGRYEGAGYCGLTLTKNIHIKSITGYKWTLIACLGKMRGWQLLHTSGLTRIQGVTFTNCATTSSPLLGVALYISGQSIIENCRFLKNNFLGQGAVAIIAPSITKFRGCIFDMNTANYGAAVVVLAATASFDNSAFSDNNSTLSGAVYISTYSTTSMTMLNPSIVNFTNCTFSRNYGVKTQEAALTINQASVVNIVHSAFLGNLGGAMAVDGARVNISLSNFSYNLGIALRLLNTEAFITKSLFMRNSGATKGGAMYIETSNVKSKCNTLTGNQATVAGGAVYILSSAYKEDDCTYTGNRIALSNSDGKSLGGAMYIGNCFDAALSRLVNINNSTFQLNNASFGAAVYIIQSYCLLQKNNFSSNAASKYGGAIMIQSTSAQADEDVVLLRQNSYNNNTANYGAGMFVRNSDHITEYNGSHTGDQSLFSGGAIAITAANTIYVQYSTFTECSARVNGGGVYAESSSSIALYDSTFRSCYSQQDGGSVYIASSALVMDSVFITKSSAVKSGGAIVLMSQSTTVTITNILITESTAAKGGGFYMIDCTIQDGDLVNTTIVNTSAAVMGGALYLVLVDMTVNNLKTMYTSGESGGMLASEDSFILFTKSNIMNSTAKSNGGAFYCIISSLILQQSQVYSHSAGANGGALYGFSSSVSFQDSLIYNNTAATGGAISISSSDLNIYRSTLYANTATNGGAIYAGLSDVTIESSELNTNVATGVGGALSITDNSLTAANSLLHNNQAVQGGAIALSQLSTFTLHSCIVSNNSLLLSQSADLTPFGGAISLNIISADSYIINSTFENNTAGIFNGGAFYATMGSALATAMLHIKSSSFVSCRAGYGGAFYLTGMKANLTQSSLTRNTANTGGGGGIYWTGIEPLGLQTQSYSGNTAVYGPNFASVPYGLQPNYTPVVDSNGSSIGEASGVNFIGSFEVNIVDQYMQIVATESSTQVALASETSGALVTGAGKATAVNGVCNFATTGVQQVPGLNVTLSLSSGNLKALGTVLVRVRECVRGEVTPAGVDQCLKCPYGQFSWNTSESSCHACPVGAVCGGGDDIQALDGYWRFPNSTGVCTNHYDDCTLKECLDVACNGLVKSSDSAMVRLNTGINGTMALILSSNSTQYNENDTLFIQGANYKVVQASALGSNQSSQIQLLVTGTKELPTTGGVAIYQVASESCKTGYTGHLCFQCDMGYTRSGKTACIACPKDYTLTVLVLVGGVFACIVVAIVLIQMTINKSRTKADLYSIICKIFTSYLQLVSLAGSFDLQWPAEVNAMFNAQSAASNPADKLISIDCLLDYYKRGTSMDSLSSYYEQLILYLCLPVLCVIFPVVFWRLRHKLMIKRLTRREWAPLLQSTLGRGTGGDPLIQSSEVEDVLKAVGEKPTDIVVMGTCTVAKLDEGSQPLSVVKAAYLEALRSEIQDKTVLSIIVLMFLIHPGVTKQIFQMFTCTVLGEDDDGKPMYFLDPDLDVPCYNFSHYRWMLCCGLPSIIGITFGIPAFAFHVLRARRTMLDDPRIKLQFGFLYDGYKLEYYYWEIWIMMRKVLVSVISVFLKNWGAIPQSLGATGLTFFSLYLHMNSMPFELDVVNNLEESALLTCLMTLYCGLYFYQPQITGGVRVAIGIVVLIVNGIFFLKFGRLVSQELKKKALDGLAKVTQHKRVSVVLNKFRGSKVDFPVQPEAVELEVDQDNSSFDDNIIQDTDQAK